MKNLNLFKGILLAVALCFSIQSYGQNPGYLGKKYMVYYQSSVNIFNAGELMNAQGKFALSLFHEFSFGYNISRHGLLSLNHERYSIGTRRPLTENGETIRDYTKINIRSYGLSYDFHDKSFLAPLGVYWGLEMKYITAQPEKKSSIELEQSLHHLYLGLGLGYRNIFWDAFVLGFEGSLGYAHPFYEEDIDSISDGVRFDLLYNYIYRMSVSAGYIF